jgi:hypothetical protein
MTIFHGATGVDTVRSTTAAALSSSIRSLARRGRQICAAAGGPLLLQWEYRISLSELASLGDEHLRELRVGRSNLRDIAWNEAHRRVDATTGQSVAVGFAVLACAVAAAVSLVLLGV